MLQAINDRIKGWLGIAVVLLIGLPFALWGIGSYLEDSGPKYAAKVNSVEISVNEFERSVSRQRQALLDQNGGQLPIEEKELRERTLNQIINQKLLEDFTYNNDYRVSDGVLSNRIKNLFSVDGVFDRNRFEAIVASNGMSIPMYEGALRNELRTQQLQSALISSDFATRSELNRLAAIENQTRDISVLTLNIEHFSTSDDPTAEEVKQYYDANQQRFMLPEKMMVDYVEITSDELAGDIEVDEQQVQQMYDEYVASLANREQRKARHILINASEENARDKILSLKQEIENGADFSTLAKEHSQDSGSATDGGDLGWVSLGEMVKPFEQALFNMESGSVSDVVETQFGFHLIKLEDVRSEEPEPLSVKRYEFEDEIRSDAVASIFFDLSERLAATAYENPDSLDVAAKELGLEIKSSKYFQRYHGEGIAANEKVRNVAFSDLVMEQGSNSDIIELDPNHVVVLRMNDYIPASVMPLDTVTSRIENILKVKSGHKQTMDAALDIKSRIESGEAVDSMESEGVSVKVINGLTRNDSSKLGDSTLLLNAFEMAAGKDGKPGVKVVDLASGDIALIVLSKITLADDVDQNKLALVKQETIRETAVRDFSSALKSIENSADIDRNLRDKE